MDVQKQIEEALNDVKLVKDRAGDFRLAEMSEIFDKVKDNAVDWLAHQQSIISQQAEEIENMRNLYSEELKKQDKELEKCHTTGLRQSKEIERLTQGLQWYADYCESQGQVGSLAKSILEGSKPNETNHTNDSNGHSQNHKRDDTAH